MKIPRFVMARPAPESCRLSSERPQLPFARRYLSRLRLIESVPAYRLRRATLEDMDLLVRHRRGMWEEIADFTPEQHDAADRTYRAWARRRLKSGTLVGFIIETTRREPVASGCVWMMPIQPRPGSNTSTAPYILSMYTEHAHRKEGHATRIVREAIRWARARGCNMVVLHASEFGETVYLRQGFTRTREMRLRLKDTGRRTRRGAGLRKRKGR